MVKSLNSEHQSYLAARGVTPALHRYSSLRDHLGILYCDPDGKPYEDSKGEPFIVVRRFPTGKPKFMAPAASGSRPYFSNLTPEGYYADINIPLVLIEGPVKVDACYEHIPAGFFFVGLTGTWNIVDRRGDDGIWHPDNDTRVLPELKNIPMKGRTVIVLFDSDIVDNTSVSKAAKFIGNWARKRGGLPHKVLLPTEPNGQKNGADDFLVRHGAARLVERLQSPSLIGYPLPGPLLTDDGDIRNDYDPAEEQELIAACAKVTDIATLEGLVRRVSRKTGRKIDELLAQIEDERAGETDLGFLCSDDDLKPSDIDSRWIVPDFLPRGELIVVAADSGLGKSLLVYDLCRSLIQGTEWLGFNVPKMRCLILQLEEGATMGSRLTAMGFHHWSKRGEGWEAGQSFDLAKPRHRQQLTSLIKSGFDFVMLDPLRAVSSLDIDENSSEIGKKVIRPLRDLITKAGASAIVIHHNSRHSGKYAGNGDIKAAVWGLFSLRRVEGGRPDELHLSSLEAHDGKTRDGDPILWRLSKTRTEGVDGSQSNCEWKLLAMEQHNFPDLKLVQRFNAILAIQDEPRTLRQIGELLDLAPDGTKVNGTLRTMAAKTASIRQWSIKQKGMTTTYWMPPERRSASVREAETTSALLLNNQLTHLNNARVSWVDQGKTDGEQAQFQLAERVNQNLQNQPKGEGGDPYRSILRGDDDPHWGPRPDPDSYEAHGF